MIELELTTVANRQFGKLSLGFRQRVTLAQALIGDPQVLLLDEPGNGLDPRQFKELEESLLKLKNNRIILVSTHRIREAQSLADRVILLNDGKIVAHGSVQDLLKNPSEALWEVNLDLQSLSKEDIKNLNLKNLMLVDPKQTQQRRALLDLIQQNPDILKSINSQEKNLEQLFIESTSLKEDSDAS